MLSIKDKAQALKDKDFRNAVRTMLRYVGEDPNREGMLETPERVRKAWLEWFQGYTHHENGLYKVFKDDTKEYDQIVLLKKIPFFSHCCHHIAVYEGTASIGYIPDNGIVIGISKLGRILDLYAKRMTIQEELTKNVADCLQRLLHPKGVAVILEGVHTCTTTRGLNKQGQSMVTSAMRGVFMTSDAARSEFMELIK